MIPLIGFAGWSGVGKTTLIEKLIPILQEKGRRVAVIKHCACGTDPEAAGKDSRRFAEAGASECVLCMPEGPDLQESVRMILTRNAADIILVEGFKHADIPRIGVERTAVQKELTGPEDSFRAVVTDRKKNDSKVPYFGWNETERLAQFIMENEQDLISRCGTAPVRPSLDEWLSEAKKAGNSSGCGMYLFHNGVVRETPKAKVRMGEQTDKTVQALRFSYNAERIAAAENRVRNMPGIFYVRVWLNQGILPVGEDLMLVLIGGDIRPRVVDALQSLVDEIKNSCVIEQEIFEN